MVRLTVATTHPAHPSQLTEDRGRRARCAANHHHVYPGLVADDQLTLKLLPEDGKTQPGLKAEVFLGRKKLGVLDAAQDGLTWTPSVTLSSGRSSLGPSPVTYYIRWHELREHFQSTSTEDVSDLVTFSLAVAHLQELRLLIEVEDRVLVSDIKALLDFYRYDNLFDLASYIDDAIEFDPDVFLERAGDALELSVGGYNAELEFPLILGDLWSIAKGYDELIQARDAYDELESEIEALEGLGVSIEADDGYYLGYEIMGYALVSPVEPYPYKRAMRGSKAIEDWIVERFEKNYPGHTVEVCTRLPHTAMLSQARQELT